MSYILDTDHLTLLQRRSTRTETLYQRVQGVSPDDIATTIISYQEQIQGWMAELNAARTAAKIVDCYRRLERVRVSFQRMNVLPFDEAAQRTFESLRRQCRTVGALDLRIASIALTTDSILLTRNFSDFHRVPGLRFEDWTKA